MNLCACCYDEVTGSWCGCEEKHKQELAVLTEARAHVSDFQVAEGWSFYCTACGRYTSGTTYYHTN